MAAEIKKQTGVNPELIAGGGGIFDVEVDGEIVFSKQSVGRFPDEGEIIRLLRG